MTTPKLLADDSSADIVAVLSEFQLPREMSNPSPTLKSAKLEI